MWRSKKCHMRAINQTSFLKQTPPERLIDEDVVDYNKELIAISRQGFTGSRLNSDQKVYHIHLG